MPRFPVRLALLAVLTAAPAAAQNQSRTPMEMAYQMGRMLLGADMPVLPDPAEESRREQDEFADFLLWSRVPLSAEDVTGTSRVVLIGDMPYESGARTWVRDNAASLRVLGTTHIGFEIIRADQQDILVGFWSGRLTREAALAALLGDNDVRFRLSRRRAFEETLAVAEAARQAGLKVTALGLSEAIEDLAFKELTGEDRLALKKKEPLLYRHRLTEIAAPMDRLQSDDLAARILQSLEGDRGMRIVVLASAGRLARSATAGRLVQAGFAVSALGFSFPESSAANERLEAIEARVRYPQYWSFVPMRPDETGLDALLLPPASLPSSRLQ